jgi:hypothetical protein
VSSQNRRKRTAWKKPQPGYKNLPYLLLKATQMATIRTECAVFRKRPKLRSRRIPAESPFHCLICLSYVSSGHNKSMEDDEKQKSKPDEEKKAPVPVRVPRKIGEPPGNLRKREQWFRKRSGS